MLHTPNLTPATVTEPWLSRSKTRRALDPHAETSNANPHIRQRLRELFDTVGEPRAIIFDEISALSFDRYTTEHRPDYHILLRFQGLYFDFTVRNTSADQVTVYTIQILKNKKWVTVFPD